jgi:hypothetical protein
MKKLVTGILIGALGMFAWQRGHHPPPSETAVRDENEIRLVEQPSSAAPAVQNDETRFHCDGRIYCSQMTSCEEATYFLRNCPGVKMDGEGDGVPCERQWCGHQ